MSKQTELANRIWDILSKSKPQLRKTYAEAIKQNDPAVKENEVKIFSPFITEHSKKAFNLYLDFDKLAKKEENEEKGITAVLDTFEAKIKSENPDLLYHALGLFLTHGIETFQFQQPSIFVSNPELIIPSKNSGLHPEFEIAVGSANETKLDWFREDPLLNEHHGHWHLVYARNIRIDRQGEMFFYMHRQMLARYDAERLSAEIDLVIPFDNMDNPIKVGYAAGDDVRLSNLISGGRNVNINVAGLKARNQKKNLKDLIVDIDKGNYDPDTTEANQMAEEIKASNLLGSIIESNVQGTNVSYSNYHGEGHVAIAEINDGVMYYTEAAIRDVIFWEWHKGVDDIYERWIKRLSKHTAFTDAPPVTLRKFTDETSRPSTHDIIICQIGEIDGFTIAKGKDIGEKAFGNGNWGQDFREGTFTYADNGITRNIKTTTQLQTKMNKSTMTYRTATGEEKEYSYDYLTHDPFCYFIRVQNESLVQKQVTIRLFVVPTDFEEKHDKWIEMDKFLYELPPNSKQVIFRSDEQSSVVRKPIVKDPTTVNRTFDPVNMELDLQKCSCGWPYHLLLPKGKKTGDGMRFRLMVMITDGNIDLLGNEPDCGSLSFCGSKRNNYPDQRPLGYPFNREFEGTGKTIANAIAQNNNMACRDIYIKHNSI